jgi:hypothetical protein
VIINIKKRTQMKALYFIKSIGAGKSILSIIAAAYTAAIIATILLRP